MIPLNDTTISDAMVRYKGAGYHMAAWAATDGKAPKYKGWDKQSAHAALDTDNIGLIHGLSNTVTLDLDDWALTKKVFLDLLGVDVDEWMIRYPTYHGDPTRRKIVFKVPARCRKTLGIVKLNFPDRKKGEIFSIRGATGENPIAAQDLYPPSWHDKSQSRYQWITPLPKFDRLLNAPDALMELWVNWKDYQEQAEIILGFKQPRQEAPVQHRAQSYASGGEDIIDQYNTHTTIHELITAHGYVQKGNKRRYQHPGSSTGTPGTVIMTGDDGKDVLYSHGSDSLSDGHAHDAFSIYTHLEHGGDTKAAYKAAAEKLGLAYSQRAPQLPEAPQYPPEVPEQPAAGQAPVPKIPWREKKKMLRMTEEKYQTIADQEYYIKQFLPKGGFIMFAADSGEGKSWLSFAMCSKILQAFQNTKVTFFDIDSGVVTTKAQVRTINARNGTERFDYINQRDTDEAEIIEILKDMAEDDLRDEIIVLDSLASFTNGKINDSSEVVNFLKICEKLRNRGALVILIHHVRKPQADEEIPTYAGSFMIKKALDALYMLVGDKAEKTITCHQTKARGDYVSRTWHMADFNGLIAEEVDYISPEQEQEAKRQRAIDWEDDKVTSLVSVAERMDKRPLLKTELRDKIMETMGRTRSAATKIIARMESSKIIFEQKSGLKNEKYMKMGYGTQTKETQKEPEIEYDDDGEESPF